MTGIPVPNSNRCVCVFTLYRYFQGYIVEGLGIPRNGTYGSLIELPDVLGYRCGGDTEPTEVPRILLRAYTTRKRSGRVQQVLYPHTAYGATGPT